MYYFKEVEKAKVLQGRTIRYLATQKLHITEGYLSQILKGKRGCSIRTAHDIAKCICLSANLSDYFYMKGD